MGKSRLVWEVTHSHRVHGWLVLAGRLGLLRQGDELPAGDRSPQGLLRDRGPRRPARGAREGDGEALDAGPARWKPACPALLALLDVPTDDPQWPTLDPPQRRRRTLDAVKRLLLRESQAQPLLVVFEDLHWIDSETQALLDALVESLPAARMLPPRELPAGVPARPGAAGPTTRSSGWIPSPPETPRRCWARCSGADAALESLKRTLIARTEGNPFFLEESVRTLVETGALAGERGAYRLARPLPSIQVPATVQAVLAARIDRLPPGDKALLQTASVIGKDVPLALLQAMAEPAARRSPRGDRAAAGRRVPVRDQPLPGPRVHVQARPHPRGGLRQSAPGPAARPSRPGRGDHRAALPGPAGRAHRAPGASRVSGRPVGEGRHVPPAGWGQGPRAIGDSRSSRVPRAGADGADPSAGDPRDAGAGHRRPLRLFETPSSRWPNSVGSKRTSEKRRPWPWPSTISDGWDGCPHTSAPFAWSAADT